MVLKDKECFYWKESLVNFSPDFTWKHFLDYVLDNRAQTQHNVLLRRGDRNGVQSFWDG
jgi:hypothetical protein